MMPTRYKGSSPRITSSRGPPFGACRNSVSHARDVRTAAQLSAWGSEIIHDAAGPIPNSTRSIGSYRSKNNGSQSDRPLSLQQQPEEYKITESSPYSRIISDKQSNARLSPSVDDIIMNMDRIGFGRNSTLSNIPQNASEPLLSTPTLQNHNFNRNQVAESCATIAQRLVEEEEELRMLQEIMIKNEEQYKLKEKELHHALSDINVKINNRSHRDVGKATLERIRLKEEALKELTETLTRLETEEVTQGQAVVQLADSLACCESAKSRSLESLKDTANHLRTGVLPLIGELRDICMGFPNLDENDDELELEEVMKFDGNCINSDINGKISTVPRIEDADLLQRLCPLDHHKDIEGAANVIKYVIDNLQVSTNELRNVAVKRLDGMLGKSSALREECDRQATVIHEAHIAMTDISNRRKELESSRDSSLKLISQLEMKLEEKKQQRISSIQAYKMLQDNLEAITEQKNKKMNELKNLESDIGDMTQQVRSNTESSSLLQQQKENIDTRMKSVRQDLENSEQDLTIMREKLRASNQKQVEVEGQLEVLRVNKGNYLSEIENCEQLVLHSDTEILRLSSQTTTNAGELRDIETALTNLNQSITEHQKKLEERRVHLSEVKDIFAASRKRLVEVDQAIMMEHRMDKDLTTDLEEAKRQLFSNDTWTNTGTSTKNKPKETLKEGEPLQTGRSIMNRISDSNKNATPSISVFGSKTASLAEVQRAISAADLVARSYDPITKRYPSESTSSSMSRDQSVTSTDSSVDSFLRPYVAPQGVSKVQNAVTTAPLKCLLLSDEQSPVTVPLEVKIQKEYSPDTRTYTKSISIEVTEDNSGVGVKGARQQWPLQKQSRASTSRSHSEGRGRGGVIRNRLLTAAGGRK